MANNDDELTEIVRIDFGIMSPDEIKRRSVVHVEYPETFESTNTTQPKIKGLTDPHMGPIDPFTRCESCDKTLEECCGHFGHIEIAGGRAIYHPSFVTTLVRILRIVCRVCGRMLIYPLNIPAGATLSDIEKIVKNKKTKYSVCGTVHNSKTEDNDYLRWCKEGCGAKSFLPLFYFAANGTPF